MSRPAPARHPRCGGEWRGPFHTDSGPVEVCNTCGDEMTTWAVTLKTDTATWSTVMVEAADHLEAAKAARLLLGDHPITRIV